MASRRSGYLTCPMCDAEVPVDGDEKPGDEVFCPYCETPLSLKIVSDEEAYFEEDI